MADDEPTVRRAETMPLADVAAEALRQEFRRCLEMDVNETLRLMQHEGDKIVLNSDDLFMRMPRYAKRPGERKILGHLLYPVAAEFTDKIYRMLLARPAVADDTVLFTAGGSATGKSTILRAAGQRLGIDFIVDTTFSNTGRALAQVDAALAAGRAIEIHFVHRSFTTSVKGMLARALDPRSGRIVPIDDMARTHYGAQRSILDALTEYRDNPKVSIMLRSNEAGGKLIDLDERGFFSRLHRSVDKLQKRGQRVLDEFYGSQKSERGDDGEDHDPGGKELYVSEAFYEAARSQAQEGRHSPGKINA